MNLPKQLFHWFQQRQSKLSHRQLLVITGQEEWTKNAAVTLIDKNDIQSILWISDAQTDYEDISVKDYRCKLGHEYDWVVLNCFSGFRANAAMALSGTIKAHGLMIILCPELSEWPHYGDPEQFNRISYGYHQKFTKSYFIQYLISSFNEDSAVAMLSVDKFSGKALFVVDNSDKDRYYEQDIAVTHICKVAQGHRNRPLILTADRGRGKSSALGIAASKIMQTSDKTIYLTAPHIRSVEQVFIHTKRLLPNAVISKNSVIYASSSITFKSIDLLLSDDISVDLLLVDEASAIPVHILNKLAKKFPRIVFSTTVHGYEGSGRGFEMRFIKQLSQLKPSFKRFQMLQPIRWYKHDTLEQFWFNTMFHNVQQDIETIEPENQSINFQHLSKAQLLKDKTLLGGLFRLLIDAHYQTSQDDLQRLLDAPEIECFIMSRGNTLLGVAQIVKEGGDCLGEISNHIADCSRRVKGHLVAQNITSTYNTAPFLLTQQWRISRIAIAPVHQLKGFGKQLIDYVEQQARQQHIEFLTTSFGCNTDILRFWYRSRFLLAKLSAKPEVSSGEHSAICIKPLTNEALKISDSIHKDFYQELLYQMDKNFQWLSEALLIQILLFEPRVNVGASNNMAILSQFAIGKRAYFTCKRLLKEYLIANPDCFSKIETQQQALLVAALLQNLKDKNLCAKYNLSGKKQIEQALKTSFGKILISH
ncbi:tRNA(Met) cytidine acetyltransferase TmcA [Paraglaciecola sp. MB-3u-78]|uniref:tRNA(Met) cytidine acetyltransferase TmcA n=1 Tax=Paraglaciecola sp. MB-3u-78 TaxID=2058332 RepID=UPI000C33913F|nr:GNAT family N-acetyltransferase [Paraglaciecola sp. MB-3u-78]PKH00748.1 tRNA(Met) cytidine acetyltransferase [Paraglaciecola sp. MB-3u-78]